MSYSCWWWGSAWGREVRGRTHAHACVCGGLRPGRSPACCWTAPLTLSVCMYMLCVPIHTHGHARLVHPAVTPAAPRRLPCPPPCLPLHPPPPGSSLATTGCSENLMLHSDGTSSVHGGSLITLGPGDPVGEMAFFTETACLEVRGG
jgi:hypothetical protein